LDDVLFRRTRLWRFADAARAVAPRFAEWMGEELGWSRDRQDAELRSVSEQLDAEALVLSHAHEAYR
jgi:glycerol-3-phosphate dehydrogenase